MLPAVESFLRHPLATMLIGFALTGVVGTMLTNHFANLRQKEAAAIERREVRRRVVLEVSRLFSERLGRAEVLAVAVERRAAREDIARLKQLYDDAEARAVRALEGGDGGAVVRECRAYELVAEARACGDVIADSLYELASVAALRPSDQQAKQIRAKTRSRIEQACP